MASQDKAAGGGKPWFIDQVAPGLWTGGADSAPAVACRLTDLTEMAAVFCRCTEECRAAVRRLERLVEVRDDLPADEAWGLAERMWQSRGEAPPYDRRAFVALIAACRREGTGSLLHAREADGRPAAIALFVHDCNTAYYVLGAEDPGGHAAGAGLVLIWRAIRLLQCETKAIDFGGPVGLFFGATQASPAAIVTPKGNGSIFYKARAADTGNMWDTWGYFHEGTYYRFCLANSGETGWDNISLATSPDGVNWRERGPVLRRRPSSIWMGTGSTWKSPAFSRNGKFMMNFSASEGALTRQTIFFAESTDLVHWTRLGDEFEFKGGGPWYEPFGRWDCIFTIPRPGGGLYGYWTAQSRDRTRHFGFGQSDDGIRWEALEAPQADCPAEGEVGAVAQMAGRYYMMYGTGGSMGMLTMVADRPGGPFLRARRNFTLLSGHTYFTRFFESPDGMLVTYHCIARDGQVYAAPFTRADVDGEGTLRLCWWRGNENMKRAAVPLVAPAPSASPVAMLGNTLDVAGGVILEGTLALPGAGTLTGLYIECEEGQAVAIVLSSDGTVQVGPIGPDATGFMPDKKANRDVAFGRSVAFRLLLEHSLLQFYLHDVLMESYSLPASATGRIGLLGEAAAQLAWAAK